MFKGIRHVAVALAIAVLGTLPALAAVPGISSTTGAVELLSSPPGSVAPGALESNTHIRVFAEQYNKQLLAALGVDVTASGKYGDGSGATTPGTIAANTNVASYFIHVDPLGTPSTIYNYKGSLTFEGTILGVVILDSSLDASDGTVGNLGTFYSTGPRGLELNNSTPDTLIVSADLKTIEIDVFRANTGIDQIRVITTPIPEPAFLQMGALGVFGGLGLLRLRRS